MPIAGMLAACAGLALPGPTLEEVRMTNRERITQLRVGMRKQEVLDLMGHKTIRTYKQSPAGMMKQHEEIPQPFGSEIVQSEDGHQVEILWYYTDQTTHDGGVTKQDLSPLAFEGGRLIGWGRPFLAERLQRGPQSRRPAASIRSRAGISPERLCCSHARGQDSEVPGTA